MRKPNLTTGIAVAALILSATGTATAAAPLILKPNSVTSRTVRDRSIRTVDLAPSARPSKDNRLFRQAVTDTVALPDVLAALSGAVRGDKGDPGAPSAVPGPAGTPGAAGTPGVAGVHVVSATSTTIPAGAEGGVTAHCAAGERALSGGGRFVATGQAGATLTSSAPLTGAEGWTVTYSNAGPAEGTAVAFAVCAVTA